LLDKMLGVDWACVGLMLLLELKKDGAAVDVVAAALCGTHNIAAAVSSSDFALQPPLTLRYKHL
jgi:hypothetical protein